jgi:hypothetical protein
VYPKEPLESYGATKAQYLNVLSLFLNQLEVQLLHVSQAHFPSLEDQLFVWVHTMRHFKLELPPTLVMAKAVEITRSLTI